MTSAIQRKLSLLLVLVLAVVLGGCIITSRRPAHGHSHSHSRASPRQSCHPSQYWDGNTCRHKGKGHGARKHDGRR